MPIAITIITKDQYGHTVHVPALNVELSGKPLPTKDDTHEDQPELLYGELIYLVDNNFKISGKALDHQSCTYIYCILKFIYMQDISPNQQMPTFETQYETTKHRDSVYHSISMMRAYRR